MYKLFSVNDNFKLPPSEFGKDIEKVASDILRKRYEGLIDSDLGVILAVYDITDISDGIIYPGDASTHHDVSFKVLTYKPEIDEIDVGFVSELADFGAFVKIGPIDGLVHVSQITDDFISFDKKVSAFVSKNSNKTLKKGDVVYTKISTVSLKKSLKESRIALTMKLYGLGKLEWVEAETKKKNSKPKEGKGQQSAKNAKKNSK